MTETTTITPTDFVRARIAEEEAAARVATPGPWRGEVVGSEGYRVYGPPMEGGTLRERRPRRVAACGYEEWDTDRHNAEFIARHDPTRVLAQCEAFRKIVKLHESWPVLVETEPTFETDHNDVGNLTMRMSKRVAWLTQREYVERFGTEPPAAPMILALAAIWRDHPDYRQEWAL